MLFTIKDISINIVCNKNDIEKKTPVLFLHGFTGCIQDWEFFNEKLPSSFTPIFMDLLGHGKSSSPSNLEKYSPEFQVDLLHQLLLKLSIRNLIIVGYSMGGRLALSYAMKYPEKIMGLILESTSFGLANNSEREERIKADKQLANRIEKSTISEFIKFWMNIPLFESLNKLPTQQLDKLKLRKIKSNSSIGLKNSLLGFSTGKMSNYYSSLHKFYTKVFLIAGIFDNKFCLILQRANDLLPNSELNIVEGCGHNVHLENPEEFLKLLNKFLLNIRDD